MHRTSQGRKPEFISEVGVFYPPFTSFPFLCLPFPLLQFWKFYYSRYFNTQTPRSYGLAIGGRL